MTIYLDKDYKCHLENDGNMTAAETDAFEGKCREYIEGFRFVPEGHTWTREDGKAFRGEMIAPGSLSGIWPMPRCSMSWNRCGWKTKSCLPISVR